MTDIDTKNFTLLIVDDEEDLRDIIVFSFKRNGFNVLSAENGREALELVKSKKVDLVISDIQMPGGNGVELLDNIRKLDPVTPPVLFLTGFADVTAEEAYNRGAEALFAKPFDFKVLLAAVLNSLRPKDQRWRLRTNREEVAMPIEFKSENLEKAQALKLINLGRGGIFVALEKDFPKINSVVDFKIQFIEGILILIEGKGIVRWVRQKSQGDQPAGCGIEFTNLSDVALTNVIELINALKTKQFIPKS